MNLGNALDAPAGDPSALCLVEPYFDEIAAAGFDTIRLPVRWSGHAAERPPFEIDANFAGRVDWAVDRALDRGLSVVVDVHHYDELQADPAGHTDRFLALWRQIARRYAAHPDRLHLELLNEPRDALTPQRWNLLLARALAVVRESSPDRAVIVGTARMNDVSALPELVLPDDDRLIVAVHYYEPFEFTHQQATWVPGADRWLGRSWGTDEECAAVRADLTAAADWARGQGRQLFVGEFGTYDRADPRSRVRWTAFVRSEAERQGLSWAYWDFATDFGAFDPARNAWRVPLRDALLGG